MDEDFLLGDFLSHPDEILGRISWTRVESEESDEN